MKSYHRKLHMVTWTLLFVGLGAAFWLAAERLNQQHAIEARGSAPTPIFWTTNQSTNEEG